MDRLPLDDVLGENLDEVVALAVIVDAGEDEEKREETVAKARAIVGGDAACRHQSIAYAAANRDR
jgi:hypothetical protein